MDAQHRGRELMRQREVRTPDPSQDQKDPLREPFFDGVCAVARDVLRPLDEVGADIAFDDRAQRSGGACRAGDSRTFPSSSRTPPEVAGQLCTEHDSVGYRKDMDRDSAGRTKAMISADELVETALRLSESSIDEYLDELGDESFDRDALVDACDQLRNMHGSGARDRAVQHMAFSLVSALFERARKQHRYWTPGGSGAHR
jgi:hypothetical protein